MCQQLAPRPMNWAGTTYRQREVGIILEQDSHAFTQVGKLERFDILAVDQYRTLGGVVQSKHQFEHGALPRATSTDDNLTFKSQPCVETPKVNGAGLTQS